MKKICLVLFVVVALIVAEGTSIYAGELHDAARAGDVAKVQQLLDKGADINARDKDGNTAVKLAGQSSPAVIKLLISRGADVELADISKMVLAADPEIAVMIRKKEGVPQPVKDEIAKGMAVFKMAKRPEDFAEAEFHFSNASRMAPWLPELMFNKALAQEKLAQARGMQYKLRDAKQSLQDYLLAVSNPKDIQTGKQKMAELDIQIQRYDYFSSEVSLGVSAYKKGPNGYSEAIRQWRKAVEIYPDHPQIHIVYSNLGEVAMYQGDLDASYNYYQKSFELMPDPAEIPARSVNMGVVLERRGDRAKACVYYKKACDVGDKVGCGNLRNCP